MFKSLEIKLRGIKQGKSSEMKVRDVIVLQGETDLLSDAAENSKTEQQNNHWIWRCGSIDNLQLTMISLTIFQLDDSVKTICVQQKPNFKFRFSIFSQASDMRCDILLRCWEKTAPSQSHDYKGKQLIPYSVVCSRCSLDIMFCVFMSIISAKYHVYFPFLVRRGKQLLLK